MADVIRSFTEGFGLGNRIIDRANSAEDRERRLERQATLEGRQDTQWQHGLDDRERRLKRQDVTEGRQDTQWQNGLDDREKTNKRNDILWDQKQDEYDHQLVLRNRKEGYQNIYLPALDLAIASGDYSKLESPENMQFMKDNPQFDLANILGEKTGQALGEGVQILRNASNGDLPEANDPVLLDSVDTLFSEITKADTLPKTYTDAKGESHGIEGRHISSIIPSEDGQGFYIQQRLDLDNGKSIDVPVTMNRTSNPNDNPRLVPIGELTQRMDTIAKTRTELSQTQLNNWRYLQEGRSLSGKGSSNAGGGGKTKGNGSTLGATGDSGVGTKYTKEYMADVADIEKQTQDEIGKIQNDVQLEPEEKQQRIQQAQKAGEKRVKLKTESWSTFTTVNDPDAPARKRQQATTKLVNNVVSLYGDYSFDTEDKAAIRAAIDKGVDPKRVEQWVNQKITSGAIKQKGDHGAESEASKIADDWVSNEASRGVINPNRTEGLSASEIVARNKLAENNSGFEDNFSADEYQRNQAASRQQQPENNRTDQMLDYNERLGLNNING